MKKYAWVFQGLLLGFTFFIAAFLMKPIGVSTQFTVLSGRIYAAVAEGIGFVIPWNYDYIFVLAIPLGAYAVSFLIRYEKEEKEQSSSAQNIQMWKQFAGGFVGGLFLLYGARMANGCTSGHMMSGISQGSLSGLVFAAAVFFVAIPVAILVKKCSEGGKG